MDYNKIVTELRNKKNYKEIINKEENFLFKCLLSKKFLSSNQYSLLIEKEIKKKLHIKNKINNISGDGIFNNLSIEIKISFGDTLNKFHFVQIRPHYNIDYYLFMIYDINKDTFGKITWFLINSKKLYEILPLFGCYAHGSKKILGQITFNNVINNNFEYALRFKKSDKIYKWLKKYKFNYDELSEFFNV